MYRWSVVPQIKRVRGVEFEVDVKFSSTIPSEGPNGETQFQRLPTSRGWVAVHLGFKLANGEYEVCKVHWTPRTGTYTFHSPPEQKQIRGSNGKLTNVLAAPEVETIVHKTGGLTRKGIRDLIVERCSGSRFPQEAAALADHVLNLIDGCWQDKLAA